MRGPEHAARLVVWWVETARPGASKTDWPATSDKPLELAVVTDGGDGSERQSQQHHASITQAMVLVGGRWPAAARRCRHYHYNPHHDHDH
jgi:hypothetical protein